MSEIRAFINYKTTDRPWGGSNSFLVALKSYFANSNDIKVVNSSKEDLDVMLLNTAYVAPGKYTSLRTIKRFNQYGYPNFLQYFLNTFKKKPVKIVLRLDGLRQFYAETPNIKGDTIQLNLMNYADAIIFQSTESMNQFKATKGAIRAPHFIIHNGVNQGVFNFQNKIFWNKKDKLNIFSTSWSTNSRKGFTDIAKLSLINNINMNFTGNWPEGVHSANVKIKPPMPQHLLAEEYKDNDIFFFPSQDEACPNVVYEALSSGLPTIYHGSGGTPEITSDYGVEMSDDLHDSVNKITTNYDSYIDRIKACYHTFSIDHAGKQYSAVFHKIVS